MSQQPNIDTVRLLLLHESQDEAELLLNTLRKAGKAARAEHARNEETLVGLLKSAEWDLLLARPGAGGCTADKAVAHARRLGREVPVLLLVDDAKSETLVAGLKAGARDVIPRGETERLLLVMERELGNLAVRREMLRLEADLRESQKRSEMLLDSAQDAVAYVTDGMHIEANGAYLELFGYASVDDLAGVPIMDLVADGAHKELKEVLRRQQSAKEGEKQEITCQCLRTDGKAFEAKMVFSPGTFDGEACTQILIRSNAGGANDAEMEARLRELSTQDPLTGLRNRLYFMEQAEEAAAQAKRRKPSTILFAQIDNFTNLRTSVGIGGADAVITEMAILLDKLFPEGSGVLARFGDDQFTALLPGGDIAKAQALAEKLRKAVEDNLFEVQKRTVQVTVSIGGTILNEDVQNGQEAVSRAADALVKVRQANSAGNGVHIVNPADLIDASTDSGMARHLQTALEKNQFKLYYQPILNLENNAEETWEVLLRLPLKDKELQPAEFLQAAAAGNLNTKIDRWVILNALKVLAEHNAKGHTARIMVTLTTDSLQDSTLVQWLGVALKAARVGGASLILQFTEADATSYLKQARQFAKDVQQSLGIQTAVTRFGASQSTGKVLAHLPEVSIVKLDGSFMQDIGSENGRKAIAALIKEAQANAKKVIASHVETAASLQVLWGFGIDYIEGYYVAGASEKLDYPFSEQ